MGIELTQRLKEQIAGVLGCGDRVLIFGTLPGICYAGGMTRHLYGKPRVWWCRMGQEGEKEVHVFRRSILALILVLGAALAACSPSGGSGGATAAPAASEPAASAPAASAPAASDPGATKGGY